jgi:glyoxylase-like metal-dependent hydrolase (beta-lactamase superfamily II)
VWVVRNDARTIVVDTGFSHHGGESRGRQTLADPVSLVADLGVEIADGPTVIVTHAHYDHIGNLDRFPAAEIVVTARELAFWTGPHAGRVQFAHSTEADEIAALARAHDEGRVTTFTGYCELGDGFGLLEVGGHTPGQLIARVAVQGGEVVLAADALHFYDELTRDRPFFVVADLEAMYAGFDTLREITDRPGRVLVAGHDADVGRRFPGRAQGTGIDDLVIRLEVEGHRT